jgi:hypothetical protein
MTDVFQGLATVNLPFSGTTDTNGNYTTTLRPRAGFWCSLKMVAQVDAGNPTWKVSDGVIPLGIGRGQRAEIGGLVAPPSAQLVIDVAGAGPSAAVSGRLIGVQGPDMESIAGAFVPVPNTVTVENVSTRQRLGTTIPTLSVPAASTTRSVTVQLPSGTQAIALLVDTGFSTILTANLVGNVTGVDYFVVYTADTNLSTSYQLRFPIESAFDTAITITLTTKAAGSGGQAVKCWASAVLDPEVVWVASQSVLAAELLAYQQQQIGWDAGPGNATRGPNSLLVSLVQAKSAPWQAPRNYAYVESAVNSTVLVAAVAGQTIWVHGIAVSTDSATGFCGLADSSGPSRIVASGGNRGINMNLGGVPLTVGAALQIQTDGVNLVRAGVSYTRA